MCQNSRSVWVRIHTRIEYLCMRYRCVHRPVWLDRHTRVFLNKTFQYFCQWTAVFTNSARYETLVPSSSSSVQCYCHNTFINKSLGKAVNLELNSWITRRLLSVSVSSGRGNPATQLSAYSFGPALKSFCVVVLGMPHKKVFFQWSSALGRAGLLDFSKENRFPSHALSVYIP